VTNHLKRQALARISAVEVALRDWDPIGVMVGEGSPEDEYDSYAPHIVSLVQNGASLNELTTHLGQVRTETMGLPANPEADGKAAAEIIRVITAQV
jgi:hypothetical protein